MKSLNNALQTEKIGEVKIWDTQTTGCLLWMDDIALIHKDLEELNAMVETTNEIAKRYHIQFRKGKSQILTINGKSPSEAINTGDTILDSTTTYKYLGMTTNNSGTMENKLCVDSPLCACKQSNETLYHFFFNCRLCAPQRTKFYILLSQLPIAIHPSVNIDDNLSVLHIIQSYTKDTNIFS